MSDDWTQICSLVAMWSAKQKQRIEGHLTQSL